MQQLSIPFEKNGKWGLKINEEIYMYPVYDQITKESDAIYKYSRNGLWGLVNVELEYKTFCRYDNIIVHREGVVQAMRKDLETSYVFITLFDFDLKPITPLVDKIVSIHNDKLKVSYENKVYVYIKSPEGKWLLKPNPNTEYIPESKITDEVILPSIEVKRNELSNNFNKEKNVILENPNVDCNIQSSVPKSDKPNKSSGFTIQTILIVIAILVGLALAGDYIFNLAKVIGALILIYVAVIVFLAFVEKK